MNIVTWKSYLANTRIIGVCILVFVLGFLGMQTDAPNKPIEYLNGYTVTKVKQPSDLVINSKYNTVYFESKKLDDTGVEALDIHKRKLGNYYLTKIDGENVIVVIKHSKVKKNDEGKYIIKGTSKKISPRFMAEDYSKITSKLGYAVPLYNVYIDTVSDWKSLDGMIIAVTYSALVLPVIVFLILVLSFVFPPLSKTNRVLGEYGRAGKLKKIIDEEYKSDRGVVQLGKNISTKNWFVFSGFFSVICIPKNSVIWACVDEVKKLKENKNGYRLKMYLVNGKRYTVAMSEENANTALNVIKFYVPNIKTGDEIETRLELIKKRKELRKLWAKNRKHDKSPYFALAEEKKSSDFVKMKESFLKEFGGIALFVDGILNYSETPLLEKKGELYIPLADVCNCLGYFVSVNDKEVRASFGTRDIFFNQRNNILMLNGVRVDYDTEKYIIDGKPYIGLETARSLLNQNIVWDENKNRVYISNRESKFNNEQIKWTYGIPAVYWHSYGKSHIYPGGVARSKSAAIEAYDILKNEWDIDSREKLFSAVRKLMEESHNKEFLGQLDKYRRFKNGEKKEKVEKEFIKFMKINGDKIKENGIIGWDLVRAVAAAGMAYVAGHIDYEEMNEINIDVANCILKEFESLEKLSENYLMGYEYWSGENRKDKKSLLYDKYLAHEYLKKDENSPYRYKWDENSLKNTDSNI